MTERDLTEEMVELLSPSTAWLKSALTSSF